MVKLIELIFYCRQAGTKPKLDRLTSSREMLQVYGSTFEYSKIFMSNPDPTRSNLFKVAAPLQ